MPSVDFSAGKVEPMVFARTIESEWLDSLPADDPRAMRSRRDLRRVNAIMLQARIMARLLKSHWSGMQPSKIVELGGGDGTFMLRVARKLRWRDVDLVLVDRQDIVADETRSRFADAGWRVQVRRSDVFAFLDHERDAADVVVANLFLHHFSDASLARLLRAAALLAPRFVACEPRRSFLSLTGSRLLFAIGCNDVSRHDAVASVRAGFAGSELSRLWPNGEGWGLHEASARPFSHSFVASRT
jgi:SAM-dependent methyltransferase